MRFTKKTATEYLKMYFEHFTELRTIANDESGIININDIEKMNTKDIIIAAQDARYDITCQISYLMQ